MSLRNVELFCEVARCRSFSRAAETHEISQSSVSQAVAQLEKRLGVKLIDRHHRPLELTVAGQTYFDGCVTILNDFRSLEDSVQQLGKKVTGRLRVAAIYSVGLLELDRYAHQLKEAFPDVDVRIESLHPEDVYSRVRDEAAEIGLVSFPRDSGEFSSILWQEQPFVLVVPPDHRLANRVSDHYLSGSVTELEGEELVSFTTELRVRRQLDRWLREAGVSPRIVHEFDNVEQIRRAVEDGLGVALLPAPTVARSVETGTLVSLRFSDVEWTRPLGVIHKRNRKLSNAASRFVELLHEAPESAQGTSVRAEVKV
jgi:DNA-binding transcriptional LysR family regulator